MPWRWRHNGRVGVSNHRRLDGLLNRLFRLRSKKTSKPRLTGRCEGNSPVTSEFPSQRTSNAESPSHGASHAENASIRWRLHTISQKLYIPFTWPLCNSRVSWCILQSIVRSSTERKQTRGKCVKFVLEIVIHGLILSCVGQTMYALSWRQVSRLTRVSFGVHFLRCFASWEMHTKIIIEQAHRHFNTPLHVLFFKSFLDIYLQPRISDTLRVPHIVRASLFLAHIAEGNCFFILVKHEEIHWNHRIIIWCSVLI